jgi:hypothetical protein
MKHVKKFESMANQHPFVGMKFKDLPFDKINKFYLGDDIIDQVIVYDYGTTDVGHKWECGSIRHKGSYEDYAFYSVDGQIKIFIGTTWSRQTSQNDSFSL